MTRVIIFVSILCCIIPSIMSAVELIRLPERDKPVEIAVSIDINKIYGVNSLEECYEIDGYLILAWADPWFNEKDSVREMKTYINTQVDEVIGSKIWFPTYEFINILEKEDIHNRTLSVMPDGRVVYNERFKGKFYSSMNFRRFPFDHQPFLIQIESFAYSSDQLKFVRPRLFPKPYEKEKAV